MDKQLPVFALGGEVALGTAFYTGTLFPHDTVAAAPPAPPVVAVPTPQPVVDDPVKRLQLDTLCGQSAATYALERKDTLMDYNQYEHSYNPKLAKCLVVLKTGRKLGNSTTIFLESILDTATGTSYGEYRLMVGPLPDGHLGPAVTLYNMIPDGVTARTCKTESDWNLYSAQCVTDRGLDRGYCPNLILKGLAAFPKWSTCGDASEKCMLDSTCLPLTARMNLPPWALWEDALPVLAAHWRAAAHTQQ